MLVLLVISTVGALLQNAVGVAMALLMGQPALFGVLCGSATLTGGAGNRVGFRASVRNCGDTCG